MREFLTPVEAVHPRPEDPGAARYVRAFLILRVMVGALGIALPFALVLFDGLWFDGTVPAHVAERVLLLRRARSCSSGCSVRPAFPSIAYKVAEVNLDNTLSLLAGVAVIGVAMFPTDRSSDVIALTPLQDRLGETTVATIHYVSAATLICALGIISYFFGRREGARPPVPDKRSPGFWRAFHWSCAGVIAGALAFILVTQVFHTGPAESLLILFQAVSIWAFGVSWLWKGLELDMLRR